MTENSSPITELAEPVWRMPVLIAMALLATFVLGGVTFLILAQGNRSSTLVDDGTVTRAIGTPLDPEKTQEVVQEIFGYENKFLSFSLLRNTYSGLLQEVKLLEASEPGENALEVVITDGMETESFFLSKQTLEGKTKFHLFDNRMTPPMLSDISAEDLQPGWGISVTIVNDLMQRSGVVNEVVVEATAITTP